MSPKSRGRKRKDSARRRDQTPSPEMVVAGMAKDAFEQLEGITDALDAELLVSELLGSWWGLPDVTVDPEVVLGEGIIGYAARRPRPGSLALLLVIAQLGTASQRAKAGAAADALAAQGVAEPAWAADLTATRFAEAWAFRDVFGDSASVLLVTERAGSRLGILHQVGCAPVTVLLDAFVVTDPAVTLRELGESTGPITTLDPLTPDAAAGLLAPALEGIDAAMAEGVPVEVDEEFRVVHALVGARVRQVLPPVPEPSDAPQEPAAPAPAALVAEFLAADEARGLPPGAQDCAQLLADYGAGLDPARPARVSPALLDQFLDDVINGGPEPTESEIATLSATVRAWAAWSALRSGHPEPVRAALAEIVDEILEGISDGEGMADGWPPADAAGVTESYLTGLDLDGLSAEELTDAVERRMFAMPFVSTRIGDEEYPALDPADPDDRGMLIEGEHPEYHAALADPQTDTVAGVNPFLHVTMHEIVANQLWDDDPPEAWQAARRLTDQGHDRHDVLHAIGEVLARRLHGVLTGKGPTDEAAYRSDLAALGRPLADGGTVIHLPH